MEGMLRVASMIALPSDTEIEAAKSEDGGAYLIALEQNGALAR